MACSKSRSTTSFQLPDLVSHCHFPLSYHKNGDVISAASDDWLDNGCSDFTEKKRIKLHGLKAGQLTAHCYPNCDDEHLRVKNGTEILADVVMNALWFPQSYRPTHVQGKAQPENEIDAGKLARDFWSHCIKDAGPGVQARFCEDMELFFEAVNQQASDRDNGVVPTFESYISARRETSGCKPAYDLIEYALGIDLPDFVINDPTIKALNQGSNDLVGWSNDIFSYNVEQSRGDTHNMIAIFMKDYALDLQGAVDQVGELCRQTIDTFCENKAKLPSWGPGIDEDVALYVQGLQDWIVGSLHWSFKSERYFGKDGAKVKETRMVKLLPKRIQPNAA